MYLQQVRSVARTIKNRLLEFTSLLNFAQLALDFGRPRAGMNSLRYALGLGRDKGFMNTLWWQPEIMARLCARALKEGIEVDYVKTLIRKRKLTLDLPPLDVSEWPWAFKVSTLGRFEILRGDGSNLLSSRGGRPIEVLKTAIAFGATDVSVDRITDVLWPNIDRDYAHRSFNTTLHRLRKLLGEDEALLLANGQLSLNDKYFWLDTWAVDQAWEDFRTSLRQGGKAPDNERLDELAERVLELYRGPFMPGDEDHPWTISARQQLSTRFLRFIGDLGGYLESNEQFDEALDLYFRGLDADDLAEGLYRRLMLCFQHLGRKAEAIEAYHRCSRTLSARLGVKPSDETTAIYDSLMAAA
jgi:DNA-binding SARP family transcriptional activator